MTSWMLSRHRQLCRTGLTWQAISHCSSMWLKTSLYAVAGLTRWYSAACVFTFTCTGPSGSALAAGHRECGGKFVSLWRPAALNCTEEVEGNYSPVKTGGKRGLYHRLLGCEVEVPADQRPKPADTTASLLVHRATQRIDDACACSTFVNLSPLAA